MNHKKITLDIERKSFESIIAMQGDNKSRYIDATIVNRSIPVDLTGCTVKFSAIKPDLTDIFNDAVIIDAKGGKVQIELTNQTLAKEGVIQATLVILKEDMQLSVLPFFITVIENPYNPNAIESKSEYKALNNALTVVDGYAKELQDASVNLEEKYTTRLNNFGSQLEHIVTQRQYIEVNLNEFSLIAKHGSEEEDWTLAFNHVFANVIKNNCGVIKWNGQLKVKSTIDVPYGVALCGASLPFSGLVPTGDFVGEYVITQLSNESHIDFRNIYISFVHNQNVKGIYIANPYDYSTLDSLVGDSPNNVFLYIGNEKIGQTLRVENVCVYAKSTIISPIMIVENLQEGYFCNNKFMVSGTTDKNLVECDGVNTTTWINNSFVNTTGLGLLYKYEKHQKRCLGNVFTANLFENCLGRYAMKIVGKSGSDNEGYNNSIMNNDYMNSSEEVFIDNLANSIVIDKCKLSFGSGARRTFNINPYDTSKATDPYNNLSLTADSGYLVGKFKGDIVSDDIKTSAINAKNFSLQPNTGNSEKRIKVYWNASDSADYGLIIEKENSEILKFYANVWDLINKAKIRLHSQNNSQSLELGCSDAGKLTVNGVEIN